MDFILFIFEDIENVSYVGISSYETYHFFQWEVSNVIKVIDQWKDL